MKTVVVSHAARLTRGKSAMMTPATQADRYRIGGQWQGWDMLDHGLSVDAIQHFGRHTTEVGDTLEIEDLGTSQVVCQVQVLEIVCVQTSRISTEHMEELGFKSREDFEATHQLGDRRMWFMRVMPISATSTLDTPTQ